MIVGIRPRCWGDSGERLAIGDIGQMFSLEFIDNALN